MLEGVTDKPKTMRLSNHFKVDRGGIMVAQFVVCSKWGTMWYPGSGVVLDCIDPDLWCLSYFKGKHSYLGGGSLIYCIDSLI